MARDTNILVRVSREEKEEIVTLARAAGKGISDYLRELGLGGKQAHVVRPVVGTDIILKREPARIPAVLGRREAVVPFSEEDMEEDTHLDHSCSQL